MPTSFIILGFLLLWFLTGLAIYSVLRSTIGMQKPIARLLGWGAPFAFSAVWLLWG